MNKSDRKTSRRTSRKISRKTYLISVLAILLIGGAVFALTRPGDNQPTQTDKPKPVSTADVQKVETTPPSATQPQASPAQNLPVIGKPMLAKSSGNNGSVPAKANIEFSCSGTVNANCLVILTNQDNPSNNLKFDAKTIKDDGHGNASVSWVWEAQPGNWTAKATLSASGYQPNSSDTQTLEVNP